MTFFVKVQNNSALFSEGSQLSLRLEAKDSDDVPQRTLIKTSWTTEFPFKAKIGVDQDTKTITLALSVIEQSEDGEAVTKELTYREYSRPENGFKKGCLVELVKAP